MKLLTPQTKEKALELALQGLSNEQISKQLGISVSSVYNVVRAAKDDGLLKGDKPGVTYTDDEQNKADIASVPDVELGDVKTLISSRGLNPDEWQVKHLGINEWDMPGGHEIDGYDEDDQPVYKPVVRKMKQLKVSLTRRHSEADFAEIFKPVALDKFKLPAAPKKVKSALPLAFIDGDDQFPLQNNDFLDCRLQFVQAHQPDWMIDIGDGINNGKMGTYVPSYVDLGIKAEAHMYVNQKLAPFAAAAPNSKRIILPDNHLVKRWNDYLMKGCPEFFELYPVSVPGLPDDPEPLTSIRRLLRTRELGWDLLLPEPGHHYGDVAYTLVPGEEGIQCIHGDLTGKTAGESYLKSFGTNVISGHLHKESHVITNVQRRGELEDKIIEHHQIGTGMDLKKVNYTSRPDWQNSALTVTIRPDGRFIYDKMRYDDKTKSMIWRDEIYYSRLGDKS